MVDGTARVVHGPTGTAASPRAIVAPAPADGRWVLTPDKAKLTFTKITLIDLDGESFVGELTDCSPVYERNAAALSSLLECPFQVPAGTYGSMRLSVSTTYEMVLDDGTNGFFTNGSGVVTTSPGTAQFSSFTVSGPGGSGNELDAATYFSAPLAIDEANPMQLEVVLDMIHMLAINVNGGTAVVDVSAPAVPAMIVPSVSGAGRAEFYSETNSSANRMIGPLGDTGAWFGVRAFYASPPQPSFIWHPVPGPSEAYNVDPAKAPPNGTPYKAGGYLGVDSTNTMCWAMPAQDYSYASYDRVCRMPLVTTIGGTAMLTCQMMASAPPPVSGDTYASGCPTITPTIMRQLTLIAR